MRIELQNVNTNKLHDELIASGINPDLVESKDNITWVTFDENQIETLNAVVGLHNPTPLPQPKTDAEKIADLETENLMNMLALAELHMMILTIGSGE